MSAACSPEPDSWIGDSPSPDSTTPGSVNPTPTAGESSPDAGPAYLSMKTYARLSPQSESIFSPEDFPAKTSVSLDAVPGLAGNAADYGLSSPGLLASFDPDTSSWRTCQASLFEGWEEFSETWPRSGTTRSGTAYRLPPSAPHIYERGSSFWPTPTVDSASGRTTPYSQGGVPLQVAVRWRTPTVGMVNQAHSRDPEYAEKLAARGQTVTLAAQVQSWPTPTANRRSGLQSHGRNAILGQLNPTWVEWLMGCPLGWTDCELSETASSLQSRATSASESLSVKE